MKITSTQNQLVKLYASLKLKKNRELHGFFLLEGEDLLKEAYAAKAIKTILYVGEKPLKDDSIEFIEVSEEIIKKIEVENKWTWEDEKLMEAYACKKNMDEFRKDR